MHTIFWAYFNCYRLYAGAHLGAHSLILVIASSCAPHPSCPCDGFVKMLNKDKDNSVEDNLFFCCPSSEKLEVRKMQVGDRCMAKPGFEVRVCR
jgi:hypothetical protein